ncbi:MAG: argininosuccinate lyase, partial [Deferribacterota bacterium]|nr:argininosuccinate lyase [Deferribacterota bacterium]
MGKDEEFFSSSNVEKKPWGGRFTKTLDKDMEEFTSSIKVDKNLAFYDIKGSRAHIEMLNKQNIITKEEHNILLEGLDIIQRELDESRFELKAENEDIHMSIEKRLIELIGPVGGKIHTARSRNDQVLVDLKMYIRDELLVIKGLLLGLLKTLLNRAERDIDIIMPGYTHMQVAQPILFSHYLMAYFQMYKRDFSRFSDFYKRLNLSPLGAAALAGTNFDIDRDFVAKRLSFFGPTENSIDTVSDRDFIIEFLSNIAISQMHSSRFAEDFIIYSTKEFSFIELPDEFTTGSSIMPQKKNPDLLELIRGKCGSVYGNLVSLLTILKGLPLSYNRDLQEDKTQIFDTIYNY